MSTTQYTENLSQDQLGSSPQAVADAKAVEASKRAHFAQDQFAQEEIRLVARGGKDDQYAVRFFVTPELNETRTVNYQEISEMRQAGGLLIYIGTQARTYSLNARFVSRTQEEANATYVATHTLKSWTVPTKAPGTSFDNDNAPQVLNLWGYGWNRQLRGVPVVITSLSIDYPAAVTYIETSGGGWVPVIQTFSIALKEARNEKELVTFNLQQYKEGTLPNW